VVQAQDCESFGYIGECPHFVREQRREEKVNEDGRRRIPIFLWRTILNAGSISG
jgi:hypothetical protein